MQVPAGQLETGDSAQGRNGQRAGQVAPAMSATERWLDVGVRGLAAAHRDWRVRLVSRAEPAADGLGLIG